MKILYASLLLLLSFSVISQAEDLILTKTSLGKLKLSQNSLISFKEIKDTFPQFIVKHEIGHGDSPTFHRITVQNKDKETLFCLLSYYDEKVNKNTIKYDIDFLKIVSSKIVDSYGIRIGERVSKVIKNRGADLKVSANHFDNSIGKDMIFYEITVEPSEELKKIGIDYISPEGVTLDQIIKENPKIKSISWPHPSWEGKTTSISFTYPKDLEKVMKFLEEAFPEQR